MSRSGECIECGGTTCRKIYTRCRKCQDHFKIGKIKHSLESRKLISLKAKGRIISMKQREDISRTLKQKYLTGEIPKQSFWKGKKMSEEHKTKMRLTRKGFSEEKKKEISNKISIGNTNKDINLATRTKTWNGYYSFWFNNKHYYEHNYIWLRDNKWGMFHIPKNWCVHHIDQNKENNHISNLVCIPKGYHSALHCEYRRRIK